MKDSLAIRMQYEPAVSRSTRSPLATFAEDTYRLAIANPPAIPWSLGGQACKVTSGILLPQSEGADGPASYDRYSQKLKWAESADWFITQPIYLIAHLTMVTFFFFVLFARQKPD